MSKNNATIDNFQQANSRKHRIRKILLFVLPLIWIFGGWLIFANFQIIRDKINILQNPLSENIAAISENVGINDKGKNMLQASLAQLNDRETFNKNCPIRESQAILLGCYTKQRIYIFNVTDERISGITGVITAHEMLHAAYERLSVSERTNVNRMLQKELSNIENEEIIDIMKVYEKTEPGQEFNELHSLIATEEKNISNELENYYKKYFNDREKAVSAYEKYQKVFDDLDERAEILQDKMESKKAIIDENEFKYKTKIELLDEDVQQFNICANTINCFASQAEFENRRAELVAHQEELAKLLKLINSQIEDYNSNVNDLNALGIEANELNKNLNSKAREID